MTPFGTSGAELVGPGSARPASPRAASGVCRRMTRISNARTMNDFRTLGDEPVPDECRYRPADLARSSAYARASIASSVSNRAFSMAQLA